MYNALYVSLKVFFAFFYTSIVYKADDIAENLKRHGGYIPGIRPGARTAEYIHNVLSRLTLVGGVYLDAICVLPTILTGRFNEFDSLRLSLIHISEPTRLLSIWFAVIGV